MIRIERRFADFKAHTLGFESCCPSSSHYHGIPPTTIMRHSFLKGNLKLLFPLPFSNCIELALQGNQSAQDENPAHGLS